MRPYTNYDEIGLHIQDIPIIVDIVFITKGRASLIARK